MRKLVLGMIIGLFVISGVMFYLGFLQKPDCSQLASGQPLEVEFTPIALTGPLSRRSAEISGMDWYGEYLILLPQYFNHADGRVLYAIPKSIILEYLQDPAASSIDAIRIPVEDQLFGEGEEYGFEGYEGITFIGNQVYLTVEIHADDGMKGYLISGEIEPDLSLVVLDTEGRQMIPLPRQVDNLTDEALLPVENQVITIFEANGVIDNPSPTANIFDADLDLIGHLPFPTIEYRLTDATRLDSDHNFWVINSFSPLKPMDDLLEKKYGEGCTHAYYRWVERLVELHYDPQTGITLADSPPIQLALPRTLFFRNWEGIARLDNLGLLIASDKYPGTILGFVPIQ
jgi:hypothetical protein